MGPSARSTGAGIEGRPLLFTLGAAYLSRDPIPPVLASQMVDLAHNVIFMQFMEEKRPQISALQAFISELGETEGTKQFVSRLGIPEKPPERPDVQRWRLSWSSAVPAFLTARLSQLIPRWRCTFACSYWP